MTDAPRHIAIWLRSCGLFVAAILVAASVIQAGFVQTARAQDDPPAVKDAAESTSDVLLDIVGGDSLAVDPGAVVTVVYRIAAQSDSALVFIPDFDIPSDWSIVFGSQDIEVPADEAVTRFVTYKVPENALAGLYTPVFSIATPDSLVRGSISSKVNVHSLHDLSISAGATPTFLAAGKSFDVPLTIANDGNARIDVNLSAENRRYTHIDLASETVTLDPGAHTIVTASVSTDADAERSQRIVLRFDATLADDADVSTHASVAFDIVPVFARIRPKAANTPLSLSLETVGDESGASPQATIHASGNMLGGQVRVDATLAESPRRRLYGQEPQVTIQYARENVSVTLGDHSTYTSPMTLTGERGVGVAAQVQEESWSVKGSVQRSRSLVPVQERAAVSATWHRSETSDVSANLLHRNEFYSGTLLTIRSLSQPFGPTSKLDLECGISSGQALQDPSCMLQTLGSTRNVSYQIRAQRASVDFPGNMAGTRMVSAFTSYRFAGSWRIEQMTSVMNRNVGSGANRHNLYAKLGVNYSARVAEGSLYATAHGIHSTARYSLMEGMTERVQTTVRLSTGYQKRRMGLSSSIEYGLASTDEVSNPADLTRARLNGRYSLTAKLHLNASFEQSQGNLSSASADQITRQFGLGTTVSFRPDFKASVTAFRSEIESHFKQQYTSMRAGVSKTFRSGKVLSLRAQFNHSEGRQTLRTADYRLAFTTPLDIPFSGGRGAGNTLNGRVVDHVTGSPIADVLLFLGNDLAITDEKGRFRFPKPGQDIVFLRIDASTIGYDRAPLLPMPMEIGPERFNGEELLIPISGTATVEGRISVFRNNEGDRNLIGADNQNLTRTGGLGNAVVQIESETLRQRTRTGGDGSFVFTQLPPGTYTVSVVRSNLDADQRLKAESVKVLVEVGESSVLEFSVVPARKRIRMIKSSSLSVGTASSPSTSDSEDAMPTGIDPSAESHPDSDTPLQELNPTTSSTEAPPRSKDKGTAGGWFSTLKETAKASASTGAAARDASIPPFYLQRGHSPSAPTHPAYPLLFVLCILFLLIDIDLFVRAVVKNRSNRIRLIQEPAWMPTARFGAMYAFAIIAVTAWAGALAGVSVSLALSGLSVALETRATYRAMWNVVLLHAVARYRTGSWIPLRASSVQLLGVTLTDTRVRHINGLESTVPTNRLHELSALTLASPTLVSADFELVFSRLTNLQHVRSMLEECYQEMRPAGVENHLHIAFEDVDSEWTSVSIKLVAESECKDLQLSAEMAEAAFLEAGIPLGNRKTRAVPSMKPHGYLRGAQAESGPSGTNASTERGSHLRLVKGGNRKAA